MILISLMFAFILCAAGICIFLLVRISQRGEELAQTLEVQLKGLSETYHLGFGNLTTEIDRLEKRLKELEEEVL